MRVIRPIALLALVIALASASAEADVVTWGGQGSGPGQFDKTVDFPVVDSAGNVFVTGACHPLGDPPSCTQSARPIQEFTAGGAYVGTLGTPGTADGQLATAEGIAAAPGGGFYVADFVGQRIEKLAADGTFERSIPTRSYGVATDNAGNVYSASADPFSRASGDGVLTKFDAAGNLLGTWGGSGFSAVATNGTDRVYALNVDEQRIHVFDSAGNALEQWSETPNAAGITVAPDGDVYVVRGSEIDRFSPTGALLGSYAPTPDDFPGFDLLMKGVAVTQDYVYVTDDALGTPYVGRIAVNPTASIRPLPPVLTNTAVTLDGSPSVVPFGHVTRYQWDFNGDGAYETDNGADPTVSHTFTRTGKQTVGLRITSADGYTDTTSAVVDVRTAPPTGAVGVSVEHGAQFTNDAHVQLGLVWPKFAQNVTISNDGGFAHSGTLPVAASLPWTLASSGPERLPKTIYVRFDHSTQTFQDDIILDEVAPTVGSAAVIGPGGVAAGAAKARKQTYRIAIRASDDNSGVRVMQLSNRRKGGSVLRFRRRLGYRATAAPRYVRVRDRASNYSRWHRIVPISVSVRGGSRVGRTLHLRFSSPTIAALRLQFLRNSIVKATFHLNIDAGSGSTSIPVGHLPRGSYKVRALLDGYYFTLPVRLR